jgi:glycine cleavage system H protein
MGRGSGFGKVILFGEHFVVHGVPGIVSATDAKTDAEVKKGESCGTIEAVKTVSEILAPVSGKVLEVNRKLNDAPDTINKDPYNEGWLLKIELSNPAEANDLLDAKAYAALIG